MHVAAELGVRDKEPTAKGLERHFFIDRYYRYQTKSSLPVRDLRGVRPFTIWTEFFYWTV